MVDQLKTHPSNSVIIKVFETNLTGRPVRLRWWVSSLMSYKRSLYFSFQIVEKF